MESIEQTFNGAAKLGQKFSCTIARNGDLLGQVYLEMDVSVSASLKSIQSLTVNTTNDIDISASGANLPTTGDLNLTDSTSTPISIHAGAAQVEFEEIIGMSNSLNTNNANGGHRIGQRAINYVEVEIGGQCIDKQYGDWMDIWAGLTYDNEKWTKWNRMVNGTLNANSSSSNGKLYVPLQFWFCRNPGLALPLIALQYHEVKLNVQFNSEVKFEHKLDANSTLATATTLTQGKIGTAAAANLSINGTNTGTDTLPIVGGGNYTWADNDVVVITNATTEVSMSIDNCCVFCDYIFLDTDERRRFAQVSHEYLIEQVQFSNTLTHSVGDDQHELRFNHPVKELVWAAQRTANVGSFNYFNGANGTNSSADMIETALLQLNGHDRMKKREGSYFRCVQPFQHHTGADGQASESEWGGYYCYSFGLKPEEHQPSGTCNFSRIDNAVLSLKGAANSAGSLKIWAVNYNVLRIMSGMGGLAYSN
jgi:hypothetical protein